MDKKKVLLVILGIIWLIGIILRIKTFLTGRPLWHDECSVALSLLDRNMFDFLRPLEHYQCAPPIFMSLSKLLTYIFGLHENVLRIIPLFAGILSLPAFYFLSKDFLKSKWLILIVNFLFAVNYQLIYYSQEFKQYSSDVLISILTLYYLAKIDIVNLKTKQVIIFGILISLLPLMAFPTAFIIFPYILMQIFKYKKSVIKKLLLFLIPSLITFTTYYITVVAASHASQIDIGSYFWELGFIKLNPVSWLQVFKINFDYFFSPNNMLLFALILFITGIVYTIKQKTNLSKLFLYTITLTVLASFFKFYPLIQRTSLYLVPVLLLILSLPLEYISKTKKLYSVLMILFFGVYFSGYSLKYYKQFNNPDIFIDEDAKTLMQTIKDNYKPDEIVAYNIASDSEYIFYTRYFNFKPKTDVKVNTLDNNKETYFSILNQLPQGRTYRFYYPFEYAKNPVIGYLKEWSKDKNVLLEKEINNSYLLKLKIK